MAINLEEKTSEEVQYAICWKDLETGETFRSEEHPLAREVAEKHCRHLNKKFKKFQHWIEPIERSKA
jgi:hypothetical protein